MAQEHSLVVNQHSFEPKLFRVVEKSQTFDYFRVQSFKMKRFGLNRLKDF